MMPCQGWRMHKQHQLRLIIVGADVSFAPKKDRINFWSNIQLEMPTQKPDIVLLAFHSRPFGGSGWYEFLCVLLM
jgi:hypothetical protein